MITLIIFILLITFLLIKIKKTNTFKELLRISLTINVVLLLSLIPVSPTVRYVQLAEPQHKDNIILIDIVNSKVQTTNSIIKFDEIIVTNGDTPTLLKRYNYITPIKLLFTMSWHRNQKIILYLPENYNIININYENSNL